MTTSAVNHPQKAEFDPGAEPTRGTRYFRPRVDIFERDGDLVLQADIPGVTAEDVDVQYEDGTLTIHGRVAPRQPAEGTPLVEEYELGDFYRTFQLSDRIDAGKISATCQDGVLTLVLPKVAELRPRKIEIQGR